MTLELFNFIYPRISVCLSGMTSMQQQLLSCEKFRMTTYHKVDSDEKQLGISVVK